MARQLTKKIGVPMIINKDPLINLKDRLSGEHSTSSFTKVGREASGKLEIIIEKLNYFEQRVEIRRQIDYQNNGDTETDITRLKFEESSSIYEDILDAESFFSKHVELAQYSFPNEESLCIDKNILRYNKAKSALKHFAADADNSSAVRKFVSTMKELSLVFYTSAVSVDNHYDNTYQLLSAGKVLTESSHRFNQDFDNFSCNFFNNYNNLKIPRAIRELNETMSTRGYKWKIAILNGLKNLAIFIATVGIFHSINKIRNGHFLFKFKKTNDTSKLQENLQSIAHSFYLSFLNNQFKIRKFIEKKDSVENNDTALANQKGKTHSVFKSNSNPSPLFYQKETEQAPRSTTTEGEECSLQITRTTFSM